VSGDVFARRLPAPGNLLGGMTVQFTAEQRAAIEHHGGDVLLDASAGAGKTSVLVERFVGAVLDEGVEVAAILAITFTAKAAAELRERIRGRLRELGAGEAARATEGAQISTIHGFCARLLRSHALQAGLDPAFTVLEADDAARLAQTAFDAALADLALEDAGAELIGAHGPAALRAATVAVHDELRARGQRRPSLPPLPPPERLSRALLATVTAARAAAVELGSIDGPPARVRQALDALQRACELALDTTPWPGDLGRLALPARNGAGALGSKACDAYREQLAALRAAAERHHAAAMRASLDQLLGTFADRYGALKAQRSAVDFEDLELLARELLRDAGIARDLRARFVHVMVDELQDTNRLQFELIDLIASGNLFMVGDAQQSIYGFRHAEVELFQARGRELQAQNARLSLRTNFRSRLEILEALNTAFAGALGAGFRPLQAGRADPPAAVAGPLVELLIVDKGAQWTAESEGLSSPWRAAEARALARRVRELTDGGVKAGDVVLLTRASTDLRVYERALEDAGVPSYLIGGRGYWSHPQVVELVSYLRALANPRDEEAWYATLGSPLCGLSLDGLVLVAAGARDELEAEDRSRLERFEEWFAAERRAAARIGPAELIERVIEEAAYDISVLRAPGGRRRLANVRKLMRLGSEWESSAGPDLHGFVALVERRARGEEGAGGSGIDRESEAPVESEALDAVRLMTIHRAKGLEFDVVCVADLGRGPRYRHDLVRISRDGSGLGLRLARSGTEARIPALDYDAIGAQRAERDAQEERRLFYVAMTRARERLLLSGAAKLDTWSKGNTGTPIDWIAPAFVPDIAERVSEIAQRRESSLTVGGVALTIVAEHAACGAHAPAPPARLLAPAASLSAPPSALALPASLSAPPSALALPASLSAPPAALAPPPAGLPAPAVAVLSYSALAEYERCGYRFYVERVLGVPGAEAAAALGAETLGSGAVTPRSGGGPGAAQWGTLVHALLERIDFRRPVMPELATPRALGPRELRELTALLEAFAACRTCVRLARARQIRREQRFAFVLAAGSPMVSGVLDVLAREAPDAALVVDYKTDHLGGADPERTVQERYAGQRLIYAVAALRSGVGSVEVAHLFLERPDRPVARVFTRSELPSLEHELEQRAGGILRREFMVSQEPQRSLCRGCPAEGGLCSWPRELTRRQAVDRLF
jgi:ATP-dependent exoDNAse (exonuclease V) beta subunit